MADDITYEWLDGPDMPDAPRPATKEEWQELDDICIAQNWMSLSRRFSRVLVARRDEKIVGFHVMQLLPHVEPLWVATSERASGLAQNLADQMVAFLEGVRARGWMVIADSPHAEKICRDRGMVKLSSPVYITPSEKVRVQ